VLPLHPPPPKHNGFP
jgi:hypothetical protein